MSETWDPEPEAAQTWSMGGKYFSTNEFSGVDFRNGLGDRLRLEIHGQRVEAGWSTREPVSKVAQRLGDLAHEEDHARIACVVGVRRLRDARKLGSIASRMGNIQLIRLDGQDSYFVWLRGVVPFPGEPLSELSVTTFSWQEAGRLAITLGAPLEQGELERLAERL